DRDGIGLKLDSVSSYGHEGFQYRLVAAGTFSAQQSQSLTADVAALPSELRDRTRQTQSDDLPATEWLSCLPVQSDRHTGRKIPTQWGKGNQTDGKNIQATCENNEEPPRLQPCMVPRSVQNRWCVMR